MHVAMALGQRSCRMAALLQSRGLASAEQNYHIGEQELLVVVHASLL